MLEEQSPEIEFYLQRSDYYNAVGFDDAVYRLLKEIRTTPGILPEFDQIVIDEFQDFNPMEVAFIEELSKRGHILVVGTTIRRCTTIARPHLCTCGHFTLRRSSRNLNCPFVAGAQK